MLWAIAKRLGVPLTLNHVPLDMERRPETIDLLRIVAKDSPIPLEEIIAEPAGRVFDIPPQTVQPADESAKRFPAGRFG